MARPRSVVGPETPAGRPAGPVRGAGSLRGVDPTGTIRPAAAAPLTPRAVRLRLQRLEPIRALDGLALVPGPDADAAQPEADPQDFAQFADSGEFDGSGTADADPAAADGAVRIDAGADAGDGVADRFEVSEIDGQLVVSVNGRIAYSGDAADSHTLHFAGSADADQLFLDPNLFQTAGGDLNLSFDGAGGADAIELGGSVGSVAHHLLGSAAGPADAGTDADAAETDAAPAANSIAADGLNLSHAGVEQVADRFDAAARTLTVDGAAELHGTGTAGVFTDGVTTVTFAAATADLDVQADTLTVTGALDLAGGEGTFRATDSLSLDADASLASAGGALTLDGGASLFVSGTVDVSNDGSVGDGTGGTATLLGGEITLTDTAVIDASGATGGGEIFVGGGARGENPALPNAEFTTIAEGARLDASALSSETGAAGDGGTVIVWANDTTRFAGSISARGAGAGGDGGFAEVSGKAHVQVSGHADLRSTGGPDGGAYGTFLIDPGSVEVVDGPNADAGLNTFNDAWIAAQLENGNLTIETANGTNGLPEVITIDGSVAIAWSAATTFTLLAGRSIVVQSGAQIVATGAGAIDLRANGGGAQSAGANFAGVTIDGATLRTEGAGGVTLVGTGGDLNGSNYGVSVTNGGVVEATGVGAVSVTGFGGDGTSGNVGVFVNGANAAIRSAGGGVTVEGIGAGTGDGNDGVAVGGGGTIEDVAAGAVSVTGTGGAGQVNNHGVNVIAGGAIRAAGGGVTVDGAGGAASAGVAFFNLGVQVINDGTIEDTGAGAVSVTGTGAAGAEDSAGIYASLNATIASAGGAVTITGTGGAGSTAGNFGVLVEGSSLVSGAGVTIDGTADGTAADILLAGGAEVVSTTLAPVTLDGATVQIDSPAAIGLSLDDDSAAPPLAGTDYSQVVLTGALTLSGGTLDLADLGSAAALQGDVYVLIDNDGTDALVGEFSDLADGQIVAFGAQRFQASYTGGDGNDLTLTALDAIPVTIDGADGDDAFTVVLDGAELVVTRSTDGGPVVEALRGDSAALTAGGLVLNGLAGNDTLTVDYGGGFFTAPIEWNGGTQTVGVGDDLTLTGGGAFDSVTHTFVNASDGSVAVALGAATHSVIYVGLEPITDNLNAADRQFVFTGGAETITLTDDAAAGFMTIDSTLGESVTFLNPTARLTIDAGSGDDLIVVSSVDAAFRAALTILGGDGAEELNLATNLTLGSATSTGNLLFDVEAVILDGAITIDTTAGTDVNGDGVFRNVGFAGRVDAGFGGALTIDTGAAAGALAGNVGFGGDVGGFSPLASLTIDAGGTTILAAGVDVTTTGAQTYNSVLGIAGASVLTGADATFNGRVVGYDPAANAGMGAEADGVGDLTVTADGVTTFNDLVGRNAAGDGNVRLASLTTDGGGTTFLNEPGGGTSLTPAVAATGTVQFDDDVVLGADLAITVGGSILFGGTLESVGDATAGTNLTVGAGQTILFAGAVGATNRLRFLQTNSSGTTQIQTDTVRTSQLQNYNNAVVVDPAGAGVAGTVTFEATNGAVSFNSTLTAADAAGDSVVVIANAAEFNGGAIGGNLTVAADVGNVAFASGTLAVTGNATVTAAGAILGGTDDGVADLTANAIDLTAASVGSSTVALDLFAATRLDVDTSAANGDVFVDGIGNLNLGLVNAGTGDATLAATGGIVDARPGDGAANVNVVANAVSLIAAGGPVGGGGDVIDVAATSLSGSAGVGDFRVADFGGGVNLVSASADNGGSLGVTTTGGNLNVGAVSAQFDVNLVAADGAITDANGAGTLNVSSTTVQALAATGIDLDLASQVSGNGLRTTGTGDIAVRRPNGTFAIGGNGIAASDGDVSVTAAAGNLQLVSLISAGNGGTAILSASGAVEDLNGAANNVTAGSLRVNAGSVATIGDPLEIDVDTVAFDADGAVFLADLSGGLTIGTVGGLTASRAGGGGAVTATDGAGDGSLTIAHAVTVGADFSLTAGDDVRFDGGSVAATAGTLAVAADAEADPGLDGNRGSISQTGAGVTLVAPTLTLSAYDGIGDDGVTDNALRIDVGTLSATNAGANDVRLVESDDVAVDSIVNVGRLVTLTAGGAITDGSVLSETPNITAGFVALQAGTGIGANAGAGNDDADLDLAGGTVLAARVTGNGPIHLSADDENAATEESLTVGVVEGLTGVSVAGTGDIRLAATFDLTIDEAVSAAAGSLFLAADSDADCDGDLRINAAVTAGAGGSYGFSANNVLLAANVTATGAGAIDVIACRTIVASPGVTVSAVDGAVTLLANAGGANAGNFTAVTIDGATISTSGAGAVSVTGTGASDGTTSDNRGVSLINGGVIAALGGGAVEVTGTGGAGTDFNYGVFVSGAGSAIASTGAGGNVTVAGTGGAGRGALNVGVLLDFDAEILAADVAAVTGFGGDGGTDAAVGVYVLRGAAISGTSAVVTGTGGDGTGAQNRGVSLALGGVIGGTTGPVTVTGAGGTGTTQNEGVHLSQDTNADGTGDFAAIRSAGGPVLVTGLGGAGTLSFGVHVELNALIENAAAGTVTVRGDVTGAASTDGVRVVDGTIRSADGDVTIDADFLLNDNGNTTPDARGRLSVLGTGAVAAGGAGDVRVTAADLNLAATASIDAAGDSIFLNNSTAGRTIGLGGGAGDFNLTDAEADRLVAAVLEIGNGDAAFKAGDVTVGELTLDTIADALVLRTGGSVIESGADAAAEISGVADLAIRADGRVGGATDADGDRLEVDVATLAVAGFDGAPAGGSVRLAEVGGNLTLGTVADSAGALTAGLRATGDVDLLVVGSLAVQNTAEATDLGGGALAAITGGGITVEAGAAVATTGGNAVLKANGGALTLAAGATLTTSGGDAGLEAFGALTMQEAGAVFASVSTVAGDVGGNVVLRSRIGDVTLTQVNAGAGSIGVEAAGAILDGLTGDGAGNLNLIGAEFAALAGTGVGSPLAANGGALDIAFDTFAAETTAGALRIDNFGGPSGNGDVIVDSVTVPDVIAVGQTVAGLTADGLQSGGTLRVDAPNGNLIVNAEVYGGVRAELAAGRGVQLNADVGSGPVLGSVAVLARGGDIVQPGADRITAGVVALEASGSIGVASFANPGHVGAINVNAAVVAARADGEGVGVAQRAVRTLTIGTALGADGGFVAGVTTDSGTASVFAAGGVFVTRAVGEAVRYEISGGSSDVTRAAVVARGDVNFAGDGRLTTRTGQAVAPLPGTLIPVTGSPPGTYRVGQTGELLSVDTGLPVDFAVEAGTRRGPIADQNLLVQLILPNGQLSPNQLPPGAGGTTFNFGPQTLPIGAELIDLANQAAANGGTLPGAFSASFDPSIRLVGDGNLGATVTNVAVDSAALTFVFGDVVASDPLPDPEPEPVAPPQPAPPVVVVPTFVAPPPFADLDEAAPAAGAPASDLPELQLWIYQDQQGLTEGLDEPGAPALTVPDLAYYLIGDPFRSAYLSDPYFQNLGAEGAVFQFVIVRPGQDPEVESTFRVESGGLEQPLFRRGPLPTFEDAAPTAPVGPPPAVVPSDAPADAAPAADGAAPAPEAAEGEPVSALDAPQTDVFQTDVGPGLDGFDRESLELEEATGLVAAAMAAGGLPAPSRASARWRRRRDAVVREMLARNPDRPERDGLERVGQERAGLERAGLERVGQERDGRLPVVPAGGEGTAPGSADADGEKLADGSAPGTLDAPAPGFPELGSTGLGRSARRARRLAAVR